MRLVILGGGGFRVPLVYRALLGDHAEGRVTEVVLHDLDAARLGAIARVLADQAVGVPDAPAVTATTDLDEALRGADFVFSAIRVGASKGVRPTSGSRWPKGCSGRRRWARAASRTGSARFRSPSTSPGGCVNSPPTPG